MNEIENREEERKTRGNCSCVKGREEVEGEKRFYGGESPSIFVRRVGEKPRL